MLNFKQVLFALFLIAPWRFVTSSSHTFYTTCKISIRYISRLYRLPQMDVSFDLIDWTEALARAEKGTLGSCFGYDENEDNHSGLFTPVE